MGPEVACSLNSTLGDFHLNYRLGDRLGRIAETIIMALATGFFGHGGTANKTSLFPLTSLQAGDTPHRRYKVEKEQPNKDPLARAPPSYSGPASQLKLKLQEPHSYIRPPSSTGPASPTSA